MQKSIENKATRRTAMRRAGRVVATLALAALPGLAACGDGGTGPVLDTALVTGTYNLTTLSFDPQGSLPAIDALEIGTQPQLIIAPSGTAQIVYQDPSTNLFTTVSGSFRTTVDGARVTFDDTSPYATLLLSRRMDFVLDTITTPRRLLFGAAAPDGVNRARLIELAPELANEQLLNPVPGDLAVIFTRS
jgi:hypothetical protein